MMSISIITATYNSGRTIADCISSLSNQDYKNIEHIIIDGKSNDNTISLINSLPNRVSKIISESDKGIYDAMNKGIAIASGDVIGFLNSDDFYTDNNIISGIVDIFKKNNTDCVFANINYVKSNEPGKIIRKWRSGEFNKGSFKKGWHPAHPAFFVRKEIYEKYGGFDLDFNLAADFEIMLRFLEKFEITNIYYDKAIINMRLGGATSGSVKNIIRQNFECYKAFKRNKIAFSPFYLFYRLLPKIKQFFR